MPSVSVVIPHPIVVTLPPMISTLVGRIRMNEFVQIFQSEIELLIRKRLPPYAVWRQNIASRHSASRLQSLHPSSMSSLLSYNVLIYYNSLKSPYVIIMLLKLKTMILHLTDMSPNSALLQSSWKAICTAMTFCFDDDISHVIVQPLRQLVGSVSCSTLQSMAVWLST